MRQPSIQLNNVTLQYQRQGYPPFTALQDFTLSIDSEQFTALVGPSGCGKSTTLSLVAGFLSATQGEVLVNGHQVRQIASDVGFIFQQDALFPWKTVLGNVMTGLLFRKVSRRDAESIARDWIRRVGLAGFESQYPNQLSGGMRKRVSLAQAFVYDPEILLMDESFSALDVQTRTLMENELLDLWQGSGKTVLFITHDLEEAIALADKVVVMTAGPAGSVKASYEIDIERPRALLDIRTHPRFEELYRTIWADLRDEVLKSHQHKKFLK